MNKGKHLLSFIKPYRFRFIMSLFCTIIYTLARTSQPFLIGLAISQLAKDVNNQMPIDFKYIGFIVLAILITSAIDTLGDYYSHYFIADVIQNSMKDIRQSINEKINRLPVSYFDNNQQGDILSRMTTDVDVVGVALQQGTLQVLASTLTLLFSVVFMFIRSPFFALSTVIIYPLCFIVYRFLYRRSQPSFSQLQDTLGDLNAYTTEHFTAYEVIQLYGQEDRVSEKFSDITDELNRVGFKSNFMSGIINPILSHIIHLSYVGLFLVMALTVLNKPLIIGGVVIASAIDVGALQSIIQYIWQSGGPIQNITQLSNTFQAATASWDRVVELLIEPEEKEEVGKYEVNLEDIKGDISFNHMSFGYRKNKLLMEDIDIDVKSGDTVAVVGPTGAGKTTLINLLMRFYDVSGGSISIDGIDIKKMTKAESRSLFGLVLQDPWLYHASMADNIRFGHLEATDEEIVKAAKIANVDHYIRTLPEGYHTILNEESSNISQGQKQLVTIARALVGNPKIIILDEATSSVDTRLELLIQTAMEKAMEDRTSFIIAHRLSTIRDADLILVMNQGAIVEQGNHEELMNKKGMYRDLYESQFTS